MRMRSPSLGHVGRAAVAGLAALGLAAPPAALADTELAIANDSGLALMEVYASPPGAEIWGEDLLHVFVVPHGRLGTVLIPGTDCLADLRIVLADGRDRFDSVNLCAGEGLHLGPPSP
jgi:hypothetical protein